MDELLEQLLKEYAASAAEGKLANYIPELAKADPDDLGIYVISRDGRANWAGDHAKRFTIQSIVKPILLLQALLDNGVDAVRARVGVPAKSGVGGGIMAVVPTRMAIGIYSPMLDAKGNSVAGLRILEALSKKLYLSIF